MDKKFADWLCGYAVTPHARALSIFEATANGCEVVYGDDETLQLDLDSWEAVEAALERIEFFASLFNVKGSSFTRSRSGNWHVYLRTARRITQEERVLLQGVLGSDYRRAVLYYTWALQMRDDAAFPGNRAQAREERECFLYEKKDALRRDLGELYDPKYKHEELAKERAAEEASVNKMLDDLFSDGPVS